LTTLKAIAEETRSDDSPTAAAVTWTSEPRCTPSTETRPADRPWSMLRATM
jgi:hypothetical protein